MVLAGAWLYLAADLASISQDLDGTVYGAIARLIAEGHGSFWYPPHFDAHAAAFHDHPPLGIWLQGQWFALAGDAFWSEKLLSSVLILVICAMTALLWRGMGHDRGLWWVLLLFLLMPLTTRTLKNNALETLIVITSLVSVWGAWQGRSRPWMNLVTAAGCLAGTLIKGPAAAFPLAAPWLFGLMLDRSWRNATLHALIAGLGWLLPLIALALISPSADSLARYVDQQLMASLAGERAIEHGRLVQLGELGRQLAVAGALSLCAWWSARRLQFTRESWAILALAICATLPLFISPRQYRHYLLPAMPLFAMWLGMIVQPKLPKIRPAFYWAAAGLLAGAALIRTVLFFGQPGVDREILQDVERIAAVTAAEGEPIALFCESQPDHRAYLTRHYGLRSAIGTDGNLVICAQPPAARGWQRRQSLSGGLHIWEREPSREPL